MLQIGVQTRNVVNDICSEEAEWQLTEQFIHSIAQLAKELGNIL